MFCNNCGKKLIEGARFCDNCGTVIAQGPNRKSRRLSKLGLAGIITASIVAISCIGSWFFFFAGPPVDAGTDKTTEHKTKMTTKEVSAGTEPIGTPGSSTSDVSSSTESILETPEQTTAEPAETSAAGPGGQSAYNATKKPVIDDFTWYTDDIYKNGRPDQAIQLEFSELQGNWKALFWYDPQNDLDAEGWDILMVEISGSPDDVRLRLDWQDSYIKSIDYMVDMSAIADTEMLGVYDTEGIKTGYPGYEFYLTDFYLRGDYQYALGYMLVASGEDVFAALVRP